MTNSLTLKANPWIEKMARTGLFAKGLVYLIVGILAITAALGINNQQDENADKKGVFSFIRDWPAGNWLLLFLALGLFCYSTWRFVEAFRQDRNKEKKKKWAKGVRYLFSGLVYLSLAFSAVQLAVYQKQNSGNGKEHWAQRILEQPFGQWLVGAIAVGLLATGIYQAWYGLSGKYKKHVQERTAGPALSSILVPAAVTGYLARGIVWLILAWMMMRAALYANSKEAGDTGEAFRFIHSGTLGTISLAAIGIGLIAYGVFSFIRAGKEKLPN